MQPMSPIAKPCSGTPRARSGRKGQETGGGAPAGAWTLSMERAKKCIARLLAWALVWTSPPWPAMAQGVRLAGPVGTQATGIVGLSRSTQVQLAGNINALLTQPGLSSPPSIQGVPSHAVPASLMEPTRLVGLIGSQLARPDATPTQIAAAKTILAALADPAMGARIVADLESVGQGRQAGIGKQAAKVLSAVLSRHADVAVRSATAKAAYELRLEIPTSFGALFDGLKRLDAKDVKGDDAEGAVAVSQGIRPSAARRGSLLSRGIASRRGKKAKAVEAVAAAGAPLLPSPAGIDALDERKVGLAARYISIKPGTFWMGSPRDEAGREVDEASHSVTLTHAYAMQATPVTQQQYFLVLGRNPSKFKPREEGDAGGREGVNGEPMNAAHPVEQVSWFDGIEYMNRLSELQGLKPAYSLERDADGLVTDARINGPNIYETEGYRYPTEAEWEYAARAGTPAFFPYSFGYNDTNELNEYGWYGRNAGWRTHAVASKKANPWGLYDMHGNVWEWTQDWHEKGDRSRSVTDPAGPAKGGWIKILRGGSWGSPSWFLRSALRFFDPPDVRLSNEGFRPVRSIR